MVVVVVEVVVVGSGALCEEVVGVRATSVDVVVVSRRVSGEATATVVEGPGGAGARTGATVEPARGALAPGFGTADVAGAAASRSPPAASSAIWGAASIC